MIDVFVVFVGTQIVWYGNILMTYKHTCMENYWMEAVMIHFDEL